VKQGSEIGITVLKSCTARAKGRIMARYIGDCANKRAHFGCYKNGGQRSQSDHGDSGDDPSLKNINRQFGSRSKETESCKTSLQGRSRGGKGLVPTIMTSYKCQHCPLGQFREKGVNL